MKFKFELNNIEIKDVKIGGMTIQTELSINEMVAIRKETEYVLENIPEYLDLLANGAKKFIEIDREFDNIVEEQMQEDLVRHATHKAIMDSMMKLFNK